MSAVAHETPMTDTNRSMKRTIDSPEFVLCELCVPSKVPKLCMSTSYEDEDYYADAGDDGDPVPEGSYICVIASCGKRSTWGPINGARDSACFCSSHGKTHGGCENVCGKRCEAPGCKKSPNFGQAGGLRKTATCCSVHGMLKGYVDIVNPRCNHPDGCDARAYFGERGGKAIRCGEHRADYVDLISKFCEHAEGCDARAWFGERGGKKVRCGVHRLKHDVDLVSKFCQDADGCDTRASFGKRGGRAFRCSEHREEDDVNVAHSRCEHPTGCDERATFGVDGGRREFCARHCDPNKHIDLNHKRCVTCILVPYKYPHPKSSSGQCSECDPLIYSLPMKKKEEAVKAVLEAAFPDTAVERELPVDFCGDGADREKCGHNQSVRARCDFLLQSGDKIVVVEVDEDAHRHYCPPNEMARVNDIHAAFVKGGNLNNRHVHFVRFNPDAFKIGGKQARVSLRTRHATLVKVVRAALAPSSDERMWSLRHMYYDCDIEGRLCIMDEIDEQIRLMIDAPIYKKLL